jgi:hypothetical protein
MAFDFANFTISKRQHPASNSVQIANFVIEEQTLAGKCFFSGLSCQFHLDNDGAKFNFIFCFQIDHTKI